jgi:hypothetical protein
MEETRLEGVGVPVTGGIEAAEPASNSPADKVEAMIS